MSEHGVKPDGVEPVVGKVEPRHLDQPPELSPELQERADRFRQLVGPRQPEGKEVKKRIRYLADLIQEWQELKGQPRLNRAEMGSLIRNALAEQPPMINGTTFDKLENVISAHERAVGMLRTEQLVDEGLNEVLGPEAGA